MENTEDYSINLEKEIELALKHNLNQLNNPDISGIDKRWWQGLPDELQQQWHTLSLEKRAALFIECSIKADESDYEEDIF